MRERFPIKEAFCCESRFEVLVEGELDGGEGDLVPSETKRRMKREKGGELSFARAQLDPLSPSLLLLTRL